MKVFEKKYNNNTTNENKSCNFIFGIGPRAQCGTTVGAAVGYYCLQFRKNPREVSLYYIKSPRGPAEKLP